MHACIHTYQARNARYLNLAVFIVLCVCLSNLTTSYLYSLVSSTIRKKRRERGEGGLHTLEVGRGRMRDGEIFGAQPAVFS